MLKVFINHRTWGQLSFMARRKLKMHANNLGAKVVPTSNVPVNLLRMVNTDTGAHGDEPLPDYLTEGDFRG